MFMKTNFTINEIETSTYSYYNTTKKYIFNEGIVIGFNLLLDTITAADGQVANRMREEVFPTVFLNHIHRDEYGVQVFTSESISLQSCSNTTFDQEIYKNNKYLIDTYYCIYGAENLYLEGSLSSHDYTYLSVEFYKNLWDNCFTMTDFLNKISYFGMDLIIEYPYVDYTDLEHPIKKKSEILGLSLNVNSYTMYDILISENTYDIHNSYLFSSKQKGFFYSLYSSEAFSFTHRGMTDAGFIGSFEFKLKDINVSHYASIYNLYDLIGQLGGIYELVHEILSIFVLYFVKKIYDHSLLNTLNESRTLTIFNEKKVDIETESQFQSQKQKPKLKLKDFLRRT